MRLDSLPVAVQWAPHEAGQTGYAGGGRANLNFAIRSNQTQKLAEGF